MHVLFCSVHRILLSWLLVRWANMLCALIAEVAGGRHLDEAWLHARAYPGTAPSPAREPVEEAPVAEGRRGQVLPFPSGVDRKQQLKEIYYCCWQDACLLSVRHRIVTKTAISAFLVKWNCHSRCTVSMYTFVYRLQHLIVAWCCDQIYHVNYVTFCI